ncbi:MAG: hypothetical protein LBI86_01530 [Treponema sp.]|jgi:hypothetical protein|nr:hypothetical protein [Treponema sp.]
MIAIQKTVDIPADRRLFIDLPETVPSGITNVVLVFSQEECPLCAAKDYTPNAETIAAIEEGRAMRRGEIPANRFHSLEEMLESLQN